MATEWLDDNTANRHKQTYVQGFLDISGGDLILRNGQQYIDSSYNYSTTDISDNSITSSQEVSENPGWHQLGHSVPPTSTSGSYYLDMSKDGTVAVVGQNTAGTNNTGAARVFQYANSVWTQLGSDLEGDSESDYFGQQVSINADGSIIAIGTDAGDYCKVFEYDDTMDGSWNQLGSNITGSTTGKFGASLSLDASGHRLALSDREATNSDGNMGYVEIYDYDSSTGWTQVGNTINGPDNNTYGQVVRLSGDGNRIIIGAAGYNGAQGTVEVYEYNSGTWTQLGSSFYGNSGSTQAYLGAAAVAISYDGSIIGMGEGQNDENETNSGKIHSYIYNTSTSSWDQLGADIHGRESESYLGQSTMDLSDDGTIMAIAENSGLSAGASDQETTITAVGFVYKYTSGAWKLLGQPIEFYNPSNTLNCSGPCISNDGSIFSIVQQGDLRVFEISQITNYVSNPTYATTNRTGNYNIRLGDISNNDTALSITKNYTTVTHDISGTYSDSYTHNPLIGDNREPYDNIEATSYKQLGIDISIDMNNGWCRLDASGTRLMAANNSGVNVYEYSHFTWTQLGSTIGLGGSNTGLRCAAISGNGEYVATYSAANDYTVQVNKYNSSTATWDSYGTLGNGNGVWIDITYDGQTIIVGENYYSTNTGRATVYEYTGDGSSSHNWTQVGGDIILYTGSQNRNGDGVSINKTGDIIVVGALGYDGHGTDAGVMQAFKYSSGSTATSTGSGYHSHDDWEPLGSKIEPTQTYEHLGRSTRMSDDGYTFASVSRGDNSENRYVVVYRYSEESSDWYVYGYARNENPGDDYGITARYLEISGDGEMVAVGAVSYNQGMIRQYKVLNGKLEPVGPAMDGDGTDYDDLGLVGMSNDGKIIAMGSINDDNIRVFQLNEVTQTITANTYKNTETETQDYIQLGNKTSGNMLEIKGTSEITGDMTINSSGTYQYIDISHVPQSIVLMDENEVYHTDVTYNGALSGYYCAVLSSVHSTYYMAYQSFTSLIGNQSMDGVNSRSVTSNNTYDSGPYVGSVITSYKESKTDSAYTDLSGEYLQIEFPFMIKPNEFNYTLDQIYAGPTSDYGTVRGTDISSGMVLGWDGTEWLKLTAIEQSDYNLYGVTKYDLSSNTHYINKLRIIGHSVNGSIHAGFGAPYLSGTVRTGTVPSMAVTSTDTDIKFNVTDLSMAGNLTIEANTFTLKNKDLNTDSDVNLIKYFPQAVGGNYAMSTFTNGDDHFYSSSGGLGRWMANIIHHTGSNSHLNGGYVIDGSNHYDTGQNYSAVNVFLYLTGSARTFSARHFMEQSLSTAPGAYGWLSENSLYDRTTGAPREVATETTFVDMNGNTHGVGGEYIELHTPLPMKYKKYHYYTHDHSTGGTQKVMFVGKKNDIYYQLSYPQTLQQGMWYNSVDLDRTDIFVTSIRIIVLESYDGYWAGNAGITQLSFDAIPSIDTHLEITNNQFGTVFNAYDKGAKGNIIFNEAPYFNLGYLEYETVSLGANTTDAVDKFFGHANGYVGIGTNKPAAPMSICGYGGRNSRYDNGSRLTFTTTGISSMLGQETPASTTNVETSPGVFSPNTIRTMSMFTARGGVVLASDERIKTNVTDIDDGVALDTLRILKPKTYEYINKVNRNEKEYVYGFMAQDVSAALPYSVILDREYIPNVYELADISNGSIVLTTNTTDVFTRVPELDGSGNEVQDASGNTVYRVKNKTLKCMNARGDDFEVTINEIIDEQRFTVKESITLEQKTHVDASGNVLKNRLFVLGEVVDDFHTLKKDAIWTISTAALQQVDRELQEEKETTAELETQLAALSVRIEALKNNTA